MVAALNFNRFTVTTKRKCRKIFKKTNINRFCWLIKKKQYVIMFNSIVVFMPMLFSVSKVINFFNRLRYCGENHNALEHSISLFYTGRMVK